MHSGTVMRQCATRGWERCARACNEGLATRGASGRTADEALVAERPMAAPAPDRSSPRVAEGFPTGVVVPLASDLSAGAS